MGRRAFSCYPPIVNVEHNEWIFRRANWTEVQVMNTKTKEEIWVPRHFLGEGGLVEEPVMIVGLTKELEYREGALLPHVRRVIEMPRAVNGPVHRREIAAPHVAPVVGIRVEDGAARRVLRVLVAVVAACILIGAVVAIVFQSIVLPHKHAVSKQR